MRPGHNYVSALQILTEIQRRGRSEYRRIDALFVQAVFDDLFGRGCTFTALITGAQGLSEMANATATVFAHALANLAVSDSVADTNIQDY